MEDFISVVLLFVGLLILVAVLTAFPVMWLWNWLMPMLFGLVKINFWQALGLSLLSSLLFKSSSFNSNTSK